MQIKDVLKYPDFEIIKSGALMLIVAKEWRMITGGEPSLCDCQFKNYLRTVRKYYNDLELSRPTTASTD